VVVELSENERLVAVRDEQFYQLGEPLNDVVQGHIIATAVPAVWCPITQKMIT